MKRFSFAAVAVCLVALSGCEEGYEEAGTYKGKPAYAIKTSVKLGASVDYDTVRKKILDDRSAEICPNGYQELSKTKPESRTVSSQYPIGGIMIFRSDTYSEVTHRITCL